MHTDIIKKIIYGKNVVTSIFLVLIEFWHAKSQFSEVKQLTPRQKKKKNTSGGG